MAIWISTALLVVVLIAIIRSEIRCGRRSRVAQTKVDLQINALAKTAFERHKDLFGKEPTGTFPLLNPDDPALKK